MTRVVSGAVLLILAVAVVWFAPATLFLIVAEALLVLACREYVGLARASKLYVPAVLSTNVCTFPGIVMRVVSTTLYFVSALIAIVPAVNSCL